MTPQGGGAESSADDLGLGLGVVLSRAAASLRSVETKGPFTPIESETDQGTSGKDQKNT